MYSPELGVLRISIPSMICLIYLMTILQTVLILTVTRQDMLMISIKKKKKTLF